jgi:hypothetical protein
MIAANHGGMTSKALMAIALAAATIGSLPAQACSMAAGYKTPTTLELVAGSDSIVLARVGAAIGDGSGPDQTSVELIPEQLVAGTEMPARLQIFGHLGTDRFQATPSDPNELHKANPDAFMGGCNRYVFKRGMLLLLFLRKMPDGSFRIVSSAFARTLEDVPDADAPWVRAVRYYNSVARLPKKEAKTLMQAERERLEATGDPVDALLAKDIGRQISGKRSQNFD